MHIDGININAHIKQSKSDIIMRNAKDRIKGKADRNNIEKPTITENAFMVIPIPVVVKLVVIASGYDLPLFNSVFNRQNI